MNRIFLLIILLTTLNIPLKSQQQNPVKKGPFSNGLRWVKANGKYGFQNAQGKLIIPPQYDSVYSYTEGMAAVKKDTSWFYIDTLGNYAQKSWSDEENHHTYKMARPFYNGVAVVRPFWRPEDVILIDRHGPSDLWGDYSFDALDDFVTGYARIVSGSKHGIVDVALDEIVPIIYDRIDSFSNGWAKVKLKGKTFVVNPYGECIGNCPQGVKIPRRRSGDFHTIHFANYEPGTALAKESKLQLENLIEFMLAHPMQKMVISGNGSNSYVVQQRSWDYTQYLITYIVANSNIPRERFIMQYGRSGMYRTVNVRTARSGETGPKNTPPPLPYLMIKGYQNN